MNASPEKQCPESHTAAATWDNLSPLLVEIRARRNEFGPAQEIPKEIIDGFRRIGIYRAMVAKRFGGAFCPMDLDAPFSHRVQAPS